MKKLVLLALLGFPIAAHADDDAMKRFKDFLPSQIARMSEEERKQTVPIAYSTAANLALADVGNLVFQAQLNSLMYDGLANFDAAKRAFQSDLGETPTGDLTVGQIHELGYRAERIKLQYVNFFSYGFSSLINQDSAVVRGTLKIIDENIAYPVNYVTIKCYRSEGYCSYNQLALTLPTRNSWSQTYSVMEVADEFYKITRWEGQQIDALPLGVTSCRTNRLSFNFATKEFYEIATNNSSGDCDTSLGVVIPRLEKPRVSQIIDGTEIMNSEFQRIQTEASGYYATAFRKSLREKTAKSGRVARPASP